MNELYVFAGPKLGNSKRPMVAAACVAALLSACATTPGEPYSEKLDPDTATTVTVLNRPIELFSETGRGAANDPFAYMAPFETNRAGERALFLWVSAPQNAGDLAQPQVLCNGQPLVLQPLSTDSGPPGEAGKPSATAARTPAKIDLSQLNLSQPPYDAPVPWNTQWYFRLPQDDLKCLAGANGISVETRASGGDEEKFSVDRKNIASLDAFTHRY